MNLELKPLINESDVNLFIDYKLKEIKYHQYYANLIGLNDEKVNTYSSKDAVRNIGKENYFQNLICVNDEIVGIVEYCLMKSEIDEKEIIYLKNIYINEENRHKGYAEKVLNFIKDKNNKRIELECWYNIPAKNLYKKLGMKEIKTRYMWE